jgi:hypothetical protein
MILNTPLNHFNSDIARARALRQHASTIVDASLKDDVLRASWMMAVGACDAYFCDAYADIVSRALRAKALEPRVSIPGRLANLKIPAIAFIRLASGGWRWRMAARELMEEESVLSIDKVRQMFNQFFRDGHKIITQESIATWLTHRSAKCRCFGTTGTEYRRKIPAEQTAARKRALTRFQDRFGTIFQRRHDCIHNCDRPRVAPQRIGDNQVSKAIEDIEFLVQRVNEALVAEFPDYLQRLGFSAGTKSQVLQ